MSTNIHARTVALGLASALTFGLCSIHAAQAAEDGHRAHESRATLKMPAGKPRPPVEVTIVAPADLQPGVPVQFVLRVRAPAGIEVDRLMLDAGQGLSGVTVGPKLRGVGVDESPAAGARVSWQISGTPLALGTQQLSGLVAFTVNGVQQAVPFQLPVQVGSFVGTVGKVSPRPVGVLRKTDADSMVDSMEAETTVR